MGLTGIIAEVGEGIEVDKELFREGSHENSEFERERRICEGWVRFLSLFELFVLPNFPYEVFRFVVVTTSEFEAGSSGFAVPGVSTPIGCDDNALFFCCCCCFVETEGIRILEIAGGAEGPLCRC